MQPIATEHKRKVGGKAWMDKEAKSNKGPSYIGAGYVWSEGGQPWDQTTVLASPV